MTWQIDSDRERRSAADNAYLPISKALFNSMPVGEVEATVMESDPSGSTT
jgi:hypothetical protein